MSVRSKIINYIAQNQILVAILVVVFVWLMIEIVDVLIVLFISYILMAAIAPYSDYLEKKRVPKPIAILFPYLITVALLFIIILSLAPFLIEQVAHLAENLPTYLNPEIGFFGIKVNAGQLNSIATSELNNIGQGALSITGRVFGSIFSAVSVFAISFYLILYRESVREGFISMFPKNSQEKVKKTTLQMEEKLGNWLRGQVVLSLVIGALTWVSLTALGIPYALPLAVIAGVLELVPTIGPILSAIPAIIVALNISATMAIIVSALYVVIQLLENHIVVPRVMQKAVGLNPIVIIIGIIIGGKLLGISGALLAIPFISLLIVVYKNLE